MLYHHVYSLALHDPHTLQTVIGQICRNIKKKWIKSLHSNYIYTGTRLFGINCDVLSSSCWNKTKVYVINYICRQRRMCSQSFVWCMEKKDIKTNKKKRSSILRRTRRKEKKTKKVKQKKDQKRKKEKKKMMS